MVAVSSYLGDDECEARRLAIQLAGQLPADARKALRSLELAMWLVRGFLEPGAPELSPKCADVVRLVPQVPLGA